MLSKPQIAKKAGLPASTTKYYMEQYPEFFRPQHEDNKPHPVYDGEAVSIVKKIRALTQAKKPAKEIKKILRQTFPAIEEYVSSSSKDDNNAPNKPTSLAMASDHLLAVPTAAKSLKAYRQLYDEQEELVNLQRRKLKRAFSQYEKSLRQRDELSREVDRLKNKLKNRRPLFSFTGGKQIAE